jgi:hypothetical protein
MQDLFYSRQGATRQGWLMQDLFYSRQGATQDREQESPSDILLSLSLWEIPLNT